MSIQIDEINAIARLARLNFNEQQKANFANDLTAILALVKQFDGLDTDKISPLAHPLDASQRLRDDIAVDNNQRDKTLKLAKHEAGLYLVPTVIE